MPSAPESPTPCRDATDGLSNPTDLNTDPSTHPGNPFTLARCPDSSRSGDARRRGCDFCRVVQNALAMQTHQPQIVDNHGGSARLTPLEPPYVLKNHSLVGRNKRSEVPAIPFFRRLRYRNVVAHTKLVQSAMLQIAASAQSLTAGTSVPLFRPTPIRCSVTFRLLSRPRSARPT